jgi:hypothetical protein
MPKDLLAEQPKDLLATAQPEKSALSRFLSGVGGDTLQSVSALTGGALPYKYANEGLNNATGIAGELGKLSGEIAKYSILPGSGLLSGAVQQAALSAATTPGDVKERLTQGALTGGLSSGIGVLPTIIKKIGSGAGTLIGELGTHTGGETIKDAARSGYIGGDKLQAFLNSMRDKIPQTDIVNLEKKALSNIGKQHSQEYTTALDALKQDRTVLNYAPIEQAAQKALNVSNFEGHSINKQAAKVQDQLAQVVKEWSGRSNGFNPGVDPTKFHTIEGLDALKKKIGNIRQETMPGTPARVSANEVYNSVKGAIDEQSPNYAELMKKTQSNIKLRKEITKELSLGENTSDSTALRKALAIPRNNANTNYGNRVTLAQLLENNGADNLMTMLNGQALNSVKPRGLGGVVASGLGGIGIGTLNPLVIPAMLTQSPRLMGELAVKTGQGAKITKNLISKVPDSVKPAIINAILNNRKQDNEK